MNDPLVISDSAEIVIHLNRAAQQLLGPAIRLQPDTTLADLRADSTQLDIDLNGLRVYRLSPRNQQPAKTGSTRNPGGRVLNDTFTNEMVHQPALILQILDTLGISIVGLDERDRIQSLNASAARLFGRNTDTIRGRHISWLLPELDDPMLANRTTPFQIHFKDRELIGYRISTHQSATFSTTVAFLDVTQLRSRETERTGLLRMLIHDLTNPLYIALNFGNMLKDNLLSEREVNQATQIIVDNLERMQDLLSDLSILEQLGENITESFEEIELDMVVATVLANLEERAHDAQIDLSLTPLPKNPCITVGNERLVRQALHNLVENAIKYTLPGGWVRVTLRENGTRFETLVSDSGIGITPSKQQRLFTPFYRVKDSRMQQVNGTGLGLSLVKLVSEQHGGDVKLFSVPERGSIFVFGLPRHSIPKDKQA